MLRSESLIFIIGAVILNILELLIVKVETESNTNNEVFEDILCKDSPLIEKLEESDSIIDPRSFNES